MPPRRRPRAAHAHAVCRQTPGCRHLRDGSPLLRLPQVGCLSCTASLTALLLDGCAAARTRCTAGHGGVPSGSGFTGVAAEPLVQLGEPHRTASPSAEVRSGEWAAARSPAAGVHGEEGTAAGAA